MVALTRLATGMCCRAPLSADACRKGTPFSYATGSQYGVNDNSFTVFGYNDFGVAVRLQALFAGATTTVLR